MTVTLAVAGKGGVGKTTIAALVIKFLSQHRQGNILAIDADPSSNLHITLGMDLEWTVGEIREEMLEQVKSSLLGGGAAMGTLPGGQTKRDYLEYHVHSALVEGSRFDLIAMGRPEGPGCYCAVNHNLRQVIDDLSRHYQWVVIDNEAGMEHLSRRTTRDVQHLLVVSDPTPPWSGSCPAHCGFEPRARYPRGKSLAGAEPGTGRRSFAPFAAGDRENRRPAPGMHSPR